MVAPDAATTFENYNALNRALIFCGLPKLPENKYLSLMLNSDEEAVYTLLMENNRIEQAKFWWFNTVYDVEIPADPEASLAVVEHPTRGNGLDILGVDNVVRSNWDDEDYTEWQVYNSGNVIATVNADNATYAGCINYCFAKELNKCPTVFINYLVLKTASEFSAIIGQKFNYESLERAETELLQTHYRNKPKRNVFRR